MINQVIAEETAKLPQGQKLFYYDHFTLQIDGQVYEDVIAYLYDKYIILKIEKLEQISYFKINFSLQLIFQLLKENQDLLSIHEDPYGIKFQRFKKCLTLLSNRPNKDLVQWGTFLEKRIVQRGFHEIFKPIQKIGQGSTANVYLGKKYQDGNFYAVKAFSKQKKYSEQKGKQSLINEIQIMKTFNHKNLNKLHAVYDSPNSVYMIMQQLKGGQLYDKIKNKHLFTQNEIKLVMKGILQGLQVMHKHKIMHRDLRPQNIFLREENDYDCVIADFGLAQHSQNDPYRIVHCGTPGYTAPEILNLEQQKAKYDPICDLFSVGVIFHLLTIRKSPFSGFKTQFTPTILQQCLLKGRLRNLFKKRKNRSIRKFDYKQINLKNRILLLSCKYIFALVFIVVFILFSIFKIKQNLLDCLINHFFYVLFIVYKIIFIYFQFSWSQLSFSQSYSNLYQESFSQAKFY